MCHVVMPISSFRCKQNTVSILHSPAHDGGAVNLSEHDTIQDMKGRRSGYWSYFVQHKQLQDQQFAITFVANIVMLIDILMHLVGTHNKYRLLTRLSLYIHTKRVYITWLTSNRRYYEKVLFRYDSYSQIGSLVSSYPVHLESSSSTITSSSLFFSKFPLFATVPGPIISLI